MGIVDVRFACYSTRLEEIVDTLVIPREEYSGVGG